MPVIYNLTDNRTGAVFASGCSSSPEPPEQAVLTSPFSAGLLRQHVTILASDAYEGRGAGYLGEAMAADYIAQQYSDLELRPLRPNEAGLAGYQQPFDMQVLDGPVPWQMLQSQNVVAILPGSDPAAGYILIGAHYDGQGKVGQAMLGRGVSEGGTTASVGEGDEIWNSAVDNAVSVAAIIEIARTMSASDQPVRRSIIFTAFGAEESALDGSTYFANRPFGASGDIKARVNLEKIIGDPEAEFLYVSYGTSTVFPDITDRVVAETGIDLLPFYPSVIANTDHYAFIMSEIPAITIGTGSVDNVHLPSDHANGLDYELLVERTKFIAKYLTYLANSDDAFAFVGNTSGHLGASGGPATQAELQMRGFEGESSFKIATVVAASIAEKAGLISGDFVIAVNDDPVPPKTFYLGLEDILSEDVLCNTMKFKIMRGDAVLDIHLPASC